MSLDPDDPRPPYVQVANSLRASILTKTLAPGDRLPSQAQLADKFGVARMTIQQALRLLREDKLIVSRQGSGVFVRERIARPVALRPHIEAAFDAPEVSIDFAGFTAETLHNAVQEPLDKVRSGRLTPDSIDLRLLLVDTRADLAVPARADRKDSSSVRARMAKTIERYAGGLKESVSELASLGLITRGTADIRVQPSAPATKQYIINKTELFFGYYPVRRHDVSINGHSVTIDDPMGKDALLFHHTKDADPETLGYQYVDEASNWFDSVWTTVAKPYTP